MHAVRVDVRGAGRRHDARGAYLVGADGGRSTVRKQCGIAFDGFTWPERFIVLTTPFDFEAALGYCPRSYFADPEEWCNCFKVSAQRAARALAARCFRPIPRSPDDELMSDTRRAGAAAAASFRRRTPYDIVHRNLYVTHQRVAGTFRMGRVLLAGDAAHVNNPIGGMGLNGGLQDAGNLATSSRSVLLGGAPERAARSLRPAAPHGRHRVRAAADDREQEAAGSARSGDARAAISTSCATRRPIPCARVSSCCGRR